MLDPYMDARDEPVEIPVGHLSDEALDGLIQQYITQFHGLNEMEDPGDNERQVRSALERGELGIFFDPSENQAALHPKKT